MATTTAARANLQAVRQIAIVHAAVAKVVNALATTKIVHAAHSSRSATAIPIDSNATMMSAHASAMMAKRVLIFAERVRSVPHSAQRAKIVSVVVLAIATAPRAAMADPVLLVNHAARWMMNSSTR